MAKGKMPDLTITPLTPPSRSPLSTQVQTEIAAESSRAPRVFDAVKSQITKSEMRLQAQQFGKRNSRRYSRRQLNYEDVRCVHVEEASSSGNDDLYTFRVRPTVLQVGSWQSSGNKNGGRKRDTTGDVEEDGHSTRQFSRRMDGIQYGEEINSYMIHRSVTDIMQVSNRLLSSFEALLDEKRGGPYPLSKEVLMSKRNLKDFFKRKKKMMNGSNNEETQESLTCIYKITLVNEFFTKAIQTGGEVVSSSRAMQDFFDQNATFQCSSEKVHEIKVTTSSAKINKSNLSNLITADLGSENDANSKVNTPISTGSPFTPNSTNSRHYLWKKSPESQGIATPISKAVISKPIIIATSMTREEKSVRAVIAEEEIRPPRTPKDNTHILLRSFTSQEALRYDAWREELTSENVIKNKRTSGDSASIFGVQDTPSSASSESGNFPYGQVRHVSGFAVKTKANGWKLVKAKQLSPDRFMTKRIGIKSPETSPLRPLLMREKNGSELSLTDSVASTRVETELYEPSALEKLIFGKTEGNIESSISSSSEEEDYSASEALEPLEHKCSAGHTSEHAAITRARRCTVILDPHYSRLEEKITYRKKGKASDLYLDLKGQSNLHTDSMPNAEAMQEEEMINISSFSFDEDDDLEGEMQEINLNQGPESAMSPLLTPISRQLAAIQKEAQNMALLCPFEYGQPIVSSKSDSHIEGRDRRLSIGIDWQSAEQRQLSAIHTEVQNWQSKQVRRPMYQR